MTRDLSVLQKEKNDLHHSHSTGHSAAAASWCCTWLLGLVGHETLCGEHKSSN
jgi:hypothetical protein